MGFFDNFPRFYKTSHTSPFPDRLNSRHSAIMERNREFIKGKRILDIASHDGRWSFAALQAGAAHVTGIEPRQELINNAMETFNEYGIEPSRFDFYAVMSSTTSAIKNLTLFFALVFITTPFDMPSYLT
ncbi:hypothetical protein HT121_28335 [Pseudomonas sp. MAFF 301514]|uniref:hypothetical protein n=1 Tax=Pseudomonas allii TaxID=2740531 RepID=UPI0015C0A704|nr:hypothetical protein [Pseudomonas allii]NWN51205.1 hypothetical protein [Pseudomonas allii]